MFENITIFNIWKKTGKQIEYEVTVKKKIEINIFETYNNNFKKILPGSKGNFIVKIKNPLNLNYKINLKEKTKKPKNLVFIIENKVYNTLEEIESVINQQFFNKEEIVINWEWKYYINDEMDIIDTKDGESAQKYVFELMAAI